MAYVNQEKKAKIAAALKLVMPRGWRYTLAVHHHSTIVCTVSAAPFECIKALNSSNYFDAQKATHCEVNPYHFGTATDDECFAETLAAIMGALNTDNHDRSDSMSDYFDVGHYVTLQFGRWDKPFQFVPSAVKAAA